jgi:hypothetical protein
VAEIGEQRHLPRGRGEARLIRHAVPRRGAPP